MSTVATTASTGTVVTTGSTTYISSTASGLDTSSLITTAVATKTAVADAIDAKVTANTNKISAYTEVQTLMNDLSSAVDSLASATNLASGVDSVFDNTTASLTSSDASVSASNVMSATTTSEAVAGSYDLTVSQLAKSMKVASSTMDDTTALGLSGTFTLGAADGTAATISVTSDMTLSDIASAISAQSGTTGVNATLIQVSSGQYKLMLTSADTGQAITATAASGDDVLNSIGVTDSSGNFANLIQSAQDAVMTLDGTTITSASNTVSDVIPGVTLSLDSTTASGDTITLTVAKDTSGVTSAINNFITAYNNLHDYLQTQEQVGSDGTVSSTAYLFADTTLRSLTSELNSLITGASGSSDSSSSSSISYLSQLGLSLTSSNDLELSGSSVLSTALASNSTALQDFFQSSFTTSDSSLRLISNESTNSLSFTLDITADSSGITGVTVNGQSGLFTVSGNELIGATGTAYAGLTFAINTTSDRSISVNLKQGLADSIVSLANQYADTSSGILQKQISSLTSTDTSLSAQSSTIRTNASSYETTLINKYATMETEISSAKTVQELLNTILNGTSGN
ncbi:MAG: flagellar filament capping protein FliD [Caulobacteraceae bacterium]|nr:flagellar filament capping protein FliD [Caulobacteraceae bacterium]